MTTYFSCWKSTLLPVVTTMSYDNMLPKWRIFAKCLFLTWRLLFVEVVFEWRGEDDSVIASNQARNGTCRFKKAMTMRWWRRWLGMLGGSIFPSGQGETRRDNYFGAERGSGQNPRVRARQRSFPFRARQKQCEPIIVSVFRSFWTNVYIFVILVSVFLGQGRAGRSSDENLTQAFSLGRGGVCIPGLSLWKISPCLTIMNVNQNKPFLCRVLLTSNPTHIFLGGYGIRTNIYQRH